MLRKKIKFQLETRHATFQVAISFNFKDEPFHVMNVTSLGLFSLFSIQCVRSAHLHSADRCFFNFTFRKMNMHTVCAQIFVTKKRQT